MTPAEVKEQKELREAYLTAFRSGMRHHIEGMKVVDPDGNDVTPDKLKEIQKEKSSSTTEIASFSKKLKVVAFFRVRYYKIRSRNIGKKNLNYRGFTLLFDKIDQLGVNTIRTLSVDAAQKANSGHPGYQWCRTNGLCPLDETLESESENF